ncbi:hypothetical protein ACS0TY_013137 [Phlomoides rotata]
MIRQRSPWRLRSFRLGVSEGESSPCTTLGAECQGLEFLPLVHNIPEGREINFRLLGASKWIFEDKSSIEGNNLVLTVKYSLVNLNKQLPLDVSQINCHFVVHAIGDRRLNLSEVFYVGQSVRSNIVDIASDTGRITLSLKQLLCCSNDAFFYSRILCFVREETSIISSKMINCIYVIVTALPAPVTSGRFLLLLKCITEMKPLKIRVKFGYVGEYMQLMIILLKDIKSEMNPILNPRAAGHEG